jgi:hypothetical protein
MVTFPVKVAALKDAFQFHQGRSSSPHIHCRPQGDMKLCHPGLPQNRNVVLVAAKDWFPEHSKGLKGVGDWVFLPCVSIIGCPEKPVLMPSILESLFGILW